MPMTAGVGFPCVGWPDVAALPSRAEIALASETAMAAPAEWPMIAAGTTPGVASSARRAAVMPGRERSAVPVFGRVKPWQGRSGTRSR